MKRAEVTETQNAIAHNVASLIEDGSVLQTGIGGIPDAVLPCSWTARTSASTANWFQTASSR